MPNQHSTCIVPHLPSTLHFTIWLDGFPSSTHNDVQLDRSLYHEKREYNKRVDLTPKVSSASPALTKNREVKGGEGGERGKSLIVQVTHLSSADESGKRAGAAAINKKVSRMEHWSCWKSNIFKEKKQKNQGSFYPCSVSFLSLVITNFGRLCAQKPEPPTCSSSTYLYVWRRIFKEESGRRRAEREVVHKLLAGVHKLFLLF